MERLEGGAGAPAPEPFVLLGSRPRDGRKRTGAQEVPGVSRHGHQGGENGTLADVAGLDRANRVDPSENRSEAGPTCAVGLLCAKYAGLPMIRRPGEGLNIGGALRCRNR